MKSRDKKYDAYVEHPRYGKRPRFTALNPSPYDPKVSLHTNATSLREIEKHYRLITGKGFAFLENLEAAGIDSKKVARIAGTAIGADTSRQNTAFAVTHYYDVERVCQACKRPFIFFAEEQRYWFETLQFPLHSDCIRCPNCRKTERFLARNRATYEKLLADKNRDWKDTLIMAGSALVLVEHGVFHSRVLERIRAALKTVPEKYRSTRLFEDVVRRLKQLKSNVTHN
jgi:hypothetical protein